LEPKAQRKSYQKETPNEGFRALRSARRAARPPRRELLKKLDQNFYKEGGIRLCGLFLKVFSETSFSYLQTEFNVL
jgi:hypothetical protein